MKISISKATKLIRAHIPEMEDYIHLIKWSSTKEQTFAGMPHTIPNELAQKVTQLLKEAQQN